jgi:hypothetical protein
MSKPYATTAQVLNQALTALIQSAQWDVTEVTGDVARRISEADNEIDSRLAGLGIPLPFTTNPPILQDLSVLYARYACLRDSYTAGDPKTGGGKASQDFKDQFEDRFKALVEGKAELLDASSQVIAKTKFQPLTVSIPEADAPARDNYPNAPNGPFPDPPGVDGYPYSGV